MIRVAIADDSAFTCRLLAGYVEQAGDCTVIGTAHDAQSTLELIRTNKPDVLTLDLDMPGAGGLDLLRQIVSEAHLPVVVISGVTRRAASTTLRALEIGAVDFVMKYTPGAPVRPESLRREILAKIRLAASASPQPVRVPVCAAVAMPSARHGQHIHARHSTSPNGVGVVVVGASTGGPKAVRDVLAELPADFATSCVIVQHLPALFTGVFAADLARHVRVPVQEAVSGDRLEPGRVLVAPGGTHLLLRSGGRIELRTPSDDDLHRPSIDFAMTSAAESLGASVLGVVLTGMGGDGARGLLHIRQHGGRAYVQEPETCVVASMPRRALALAGADYVAPPDRIGHLLARRTA